jgi:hypothetical protein
MASSFVAIATIARGEGFCRSFRRCSKSTGRDMRHDITSEQLAARGGQNPLASSWPPPLPQPPPLRRRRNGRTPAAFEAPLPRGLATKLPGQIELGPTHAGPAAQEATEEPYLYRYPRHSPRCRLVALAASLLPVAGTNCHQPSLFGLTVTSPPQRRRRENHSPGATPLSPFYL